MAMAPDFHTIEEGRNIGDLSMLFHPYFDGLAKTVWVSKSGNVYFGGNALYVYRDNQTSEVKSLPGNQSNDNVSGKYFGFISQVRGSGENDIFMVGEGNTIRHFNGLKWRQLGLPYDFSSDYTWLAVSIKNNLVITVGYSSSQAIIMVLKR